MLLDMISFGDNQVGVPRFFLVVALLDQLLLRRDRPAHFAFSARRHFDRLASIHEVTPTFLFIKETNLALFVFYFRLVARNNPFPNILAPVLHSRVSVLNPKIES